MLHKLPPISLSIYRLSITCGVLGLLLGIMIVTDALLLDGPLTPEDTWLAAIPLGFGGLFMLRALLGRRFGIEKDNAPSCLIPSRAADF